MFRKSVIAAAALATLATAALPTSASAHRWRHHGLYGLGIGIGLGMVGAGIYASGCQTVYEWRMNRRGVYYQVPVTYCY